MRSTGMIPWWLSCAMIMVVGVVCTGCGRTDSPTISPAAPAAKLAEPEFHVSLHNWSSSLNANSKGEISRSWLTDNPDSMPVQSLAAFIGHSASGKLSAEQMTQIRGWFGKNEKMLFALKPQYGEESKDGRDRYGPQYYEFAFAGHSIKVVYWHDLPEDAKTVIAELQSMLDKMLPELGGTETNYAHPSYGTIMFSTTGAITITQPTPTSPN
jgi:hypothetical protein